MTEVAGERPEGVEAQVPNTERAGRFLQLHVQVPTDYDAYFREMLAQWQENAEDAAESGESVRPMWLRRNAEDPSEFAAHVDYLMPMADGARYFAAIDINTDGGVSEVEVWMPSADGSGEPVVVKREAYTLAALGRAIEYVESNV